MTGSSVNLYLRFASLVHTNIFGTNTLLHLKIWSKGDIELFTANFVITTVWQ